LLTIGVVAAVAAVWAIGLGIVDRAAPHPRRISYDASPTARLERRPVLFVIMRDETAVPPGAKPSSIAARAVPIALLEPSGELRPPISSSEDSTKRSAATSAFVDTYLHPDSALRLLQGGAAAGAMRIVESDDSGPLPAGWGVCEASDRSALAQSGATLLGISDLRFGSARSGDEPMREADRAVVSALLRRVVTDQYPGVHVEAVDEVKVRAVDLNRDGRRELVATAQARGRSGSRATPTVDCFLIAELADDTNYRVAFASVVERPAEAEDSSILTFVDQIDLSPADFDEVVVRSALPGKQYRVLRRDVGGWREVYVSPVVP